MDNVELTPVSNDRGDCPALFCQLNEYISYKSGKEKWVEHSRWIKFEEVVESTGEHWSKPHVGLLNFESLKGVKQLFENGFISLDHPGSTLLEILNNALDAAISMKVIDEADKEPLLKIFQKGHKRPKPRTKISPRGSQSSLFKLGTETPKPARKNESKHLLNVDNQNDSDENDLESKFDTRYKKKIPLGSEVANILVAPLQRLDESVVLFLRLKDSLLIRSYSEVEIPTKFIVMILGPSEENSTLLECGRVIGSLLADNVFRKTIYKTSSQTHIIQGIDEFVNSAFVIPPGEWNPDVRIHPPKDKIPTRQPTSPNSENGDRHTPDLGDEAEEDDEIELVRTNRFFGGLIDDVKRKSKFYVSDFKDALHIQCLSTYAFLYFACLTPIITFGGLLMVATDGYLGAMESIISGAIVGMAYALFAGQPLTILSSTGPILVFETIMFRICTSLNWDFLVLRMWIGIWLMSYLLIMVAFDLSVLVKYITKFTEEVFAMLIALIYIIEAFKNIFDLLDDFPINRKWNPNYVLNRTCVCVPPNNTNLPTIINEHTKRLMKYEKPPLLPSFTNQSGSILNYIDWGNISDGYFSWKTHEFKQMCVDYGGYWAGNTCGKLYVPDVFFISWILMIGTFATAWGLKLFRRSRLLPNIVRHTLSNFAVVASIATFTLIDFLIGVQTPKLVVPNRLEPTLGYGIRSWICPILGKNPWWTIPFASIPALLAVILIFLDQQITSVIINRKKNKLKKGYGYHLDLFVVAILIGINSVMGVPWFVAGTVLSMNHVMSLKKESTNNAPGELPVFLGCREQRVTHFLIFFTVGMSIFITPVLQKIPMPVLYGVFLYMGVSPLGEIDMIQRVSLFFMSGKNRPDIKYLRFIPIRRVHLFTVIQILSLAGLWTIKSVKVLSIGFPIMVLAMCFIRKGMDWIFNQEELKNLDQLLPPMTVSNSSGCCKKRREECDQEEHKFHNEAPIITIEEPTVLND